MGVDNCSAQRWFAGNRHTIPAGMGMSPTFHTLPGRGVSSCDFAGCVCALWCVCCRRCLWNVSESATKSHPVFKAKVGFLVCSGSFKSAPDQISVAATKTLGPNLFVPVLTLFSMLLQSMECVKTWGSWRSQECPVEMFTPNVSDKPNPSLA